MKKTLFSLIYLVLGLLSITSCNDEEKVTPTTIGDVYIRTKMIDNKQQYGLVSYCFSNFELKDVKIATPTADADSLVLEKYANYKTIFRIYPIEDEDFSETIPAKGKYTFVVKSVDEEKFVREDELSEDIAAFANLTVFKKNGNIIELKWEKASNADYYGIRLLDKDDKAIYNINFLKNTTTEVEISNYAKGWFFDDKKTESAKKIQLLAYKFEDSNNPGEYDIQSISQIEETLLIEEEEEKK